MVSDSNARRGKHIGSFVFGRKKKLRLNLRKSRFGFFRTGRRRLTWKHEKCANISICRSCLAFFFLFIYMYTELLKVHPVNLKNAHTQTHTHTHTHKKKRNPTKKEQRIFLPHCDRAACSPFCRQARLPLWHSSG